MIQPLQQLPPLPSQLDQVELLDFVGKDFIFCQAFKGATGLIYSVLYIFFIRLESHLSSTFFLFFKKHDLQTLPKIYRPSNS